MLENKIHGRERYVDVIAGIMIAWMILGHCRFFSGISLSFFKFLSFYMPWFFYKSGMFFTAKNPKQLIKKDTAKLLRYFVIYSAIGWGVWSVCGMVDGSLSLTECFLRPVRDFIHHGSIYGNGALWFLLSLFVVRQVANVLIIKKSPPSILVMSCFIIAFLLYAKGWYNHSWWFGNAFSGLCFFLLGYWLKNKESNSWLFVFSTVSYGLVVAAYFVGWIDDFPYLYMHANKMYNGNYLLFYPTAIAGIIMVNNFFRLLCKRVKFCALEYIGLNSMTFYTTHWILFVLVTFVTKYIFHVQKPYVLFTVLLCASIILLPVLIETINCIRNKKHIKFI